MFGRRCFQLRRCGAVRNRTYRGDSPDFPLAGTECPINSKLYYKMGTPLKNDTITAINGIRVGNATDEKARTGCTVILCESGAVAGVDVRGSAPGTRETDAIRPGGLVEKVHAVLLTGGSAFGLDAAGGVMQFLEERGVGFPAGPVRVPIVPSAVIFDLGYRRFKGPSRSGDGLPRLRERHQCSSPDGTDRCWNRRNSWEGTRTSAIKWRPRISVSRLEIRTDRRGDCRRQRGRKHF